MNKYIWEEFKRVIIKKKISIIIILMFIIAFGLINVLGTKTLEVQLQQYKTLLNTQNRIKNEATTKFKKAEFLRDIIGTEKIIADRQEQLDIINSYDKSKLDEKIQMLGKKIILKMNIK